MTIIEEYDHKGFTIQKQKPSNRYIYKIYKDEEYKQTALSKKGAINLINFCIERGLW